MLKIFNDTTGSNDADQLHNKLNNNTHFYNTTNMNTNINHNNINNSNNNNNNISNINNSIPKINITSVNNMMFSLPKSETTHSNGNPIETHPEMTFSNSSSSSSSDRKNNIILPPLSSISNKFIPNTNSPFNNNNNNTSPRSINSNTMLNNPSSPTSSIPNNISLMTQQNYNTNSFQPYDLKPKLTSPEQYISQLTQRHFQQQQELFSQQHSHLPHIYQTEVINNNNNSSNNSFGILNQQNKKISLPSVNQILPKTLNDSQKPISPMETLYLNNNNNTENKHINHNEEVIMQKKNINNNPLIMERSRSGNSIDTKHKVKKLQRKNSSSEKLVHINCPICHRVFNRQSSYQNHKNTHTGARPFMCKTCGKTFNASPNLSRHKKIHEKEKRGKQKGIN